jgi:aromatic ring hydroxylase
VGLRYGWTRQDDAEAGASLPRPAYWNVSPTVENGEVKSLSGYIGDSTAGGVIQTLPSVAEFVDIFGDRSVLICWSTE